MKGAQLVKGVGVHRSPKKVIHLCPRRSRANFINYQERQPSRRGVLSLPLAIRRS